jgi:cation-transporting ATPase E
MTLLTIGLVVLVMISVPLEPWKIGLAAVMAGGYVLAMVIPVAREYFELDLPPDWAWIVYGACAAVGSLVVIALPRIVPTGAHGHDER